MYPSLSKRGLKRNKKLAKRDKAKKEGKKSMAFTLSLSDLKKEVSAEDVERVVKKILGNLKFKLGIEIR